MEIVELIMGWVLTIFIGLLGAVIIWLVIQRRIDLQYLISERNGQASMSRFQFLIFTFVIAGGFFLIVVNTMKFPEVPNSVLALLGISGGSYLVSKGIQASLKGDGSPAQPKPEKPKKG